MDLAAIDRYITINLNWRGKYPCFEAFWLYYGRRPMAELYHLIDIGSEAALFLRLARRCNASGNSEVAACSRHISTLQCTPWKHPQAAGKHERFISF